MPKHIKTPTLIKAAGTAEKLISEFAGRVNTGNHDISIAQMKSAPGWTEPGQTPDFEEFTLVLNGVVHVETKQGNFDIRQGEMFIAAKGEWVRYSTPSDGAEYVAVCIPAFSPDTVHRDE